MRRNWISKYSTQDIYNSFFFTYQPGVELSVLNLQGFCFCAQVHYILQEVVMGGMVLETNMNEIVAQVEIQNRMEKSEVSFSSWLVLHLPRADCTPPKSDRTLMAFSCVNSQKPQQSFLM